MSITGGKATNAKLSRLTQEMKDAMARAVETGAQEVQAEAKEILTEVDWTVGKHGLTRRKEDNNPVFYAPGTAMKGHIDYGDLRRSIQIKVGWAGRYTIIGVIGTDVEYAPDIEALPDGGFLLPAALRKGKAAKDYAVKEIAGIIRRAGTK